MTTKNCIVCGKGFYCRPSVYDQRKTCSKKCDAEYRKTKVGPANPRYKRVKSICAVCGEEYLVHPSSKERRKTCSKSCLYKLRSQRMKTPKNPLYKNAKLHGKCIVCGKEFTYYNCLVKKGATRKCCSKKCSNKHQSVKYSGANSFSWLGGDIRYYGPNWNVSQERARKRDNYTCQICGVHESDLRRFLDVHHKKPFRLCSDFYEANKLENLISLCAECHKQAERESRRIYGTPKNWGVNRKIKSPWFSSTQAGEIIGISNSGVRAAIRRGYLKAEDINEGMCKQPRYIIHVDEVVSYKKRYKTKTLP
jgi:5-methylcytosine-specific restriction endonuclease McrA